MHRYSLPSQQHMYMETQCAVADPDENGGMAIHSSTQTLDGVQSAAARALGIPCHAVTASEPPPQKMPGSLPVVSADLSVTSFFCRGAAPADMKTSLASGRHNGACCEEGLAASCDDRMVAKTQMAVTERVLCVLQHAGVWAVHLAARLPAPCQLQRLQPWQPPKQAAECATLSAAMTTCA